MGYKWSSGERRRLAVSRFESRYRESYSVYGINFSLAYRCLFEYLSSYRISVIAGLVCSVLAEHSNFLTVLCVRVLCCTSSSVLFAFFFDIRIILVLLWLFVWIREILYFGSFLYHDSCGSSSSRWNVIYLKLLGVCWWCALLRLLPRRCGSTFPSIMTLFSTRKTVGCPAFFPAVTSGMCL